MIVHIFESFGEVGAGFTINLAQSGQEFFVYTQQQDTGKVSQVSTFKSRIKAKKKYGDQVMGNRFFS